MASILSDPGLSFGQAVWVTGITWLNFRLPVLSTQTKQYLEVKGHAKKIEF